MWCARRLIGDKSFAVILPDDLVVSDRPCLAQMMEAHAEFGGNVVATMEVSDAETPSYGVLDVVETIGKVLRPRGIVEKPALGTAPSNHAVVGRYILTPAVMKHLNDKTTGAGGEIQLTDAIAKEMAVNPGSVVGLCFDGTRFDCGSKIGMLKATVALALSRDDRRDELAGFLEQILGVKLPSPAAKPGTIAAE